MPGMYAVGTTAAGTNLTLLLLTSIASSRPAVHQILVSSWVVPPADASAKFQILRQTGVATGGTAVVARPADPGGAAGLVVATRGSFGAEPTYEASPLLEFALNQRATFTWIANPGREIKCPLGTSNGVGTRCIASGDTSERSCTMAWDE